MSSTAPRAIRSDRHVPELDGVRGIAIAAVMALHFVSNMIAEPSNWIEKLLVKATSYGVWGVDLFFVLSGFLITGILYDAKGSAHYFRSFYMRRTLRIFPLYYGVLLVLMLLVPEGLLAAHAHDMLEARSHQAWLWPYLTNVYLARVGEFSLPYVSHFWTLAIEEHFYLLWPFAVAFLSGRAAQKLCVVLGLFSLALRITLHAVGVNAVAVQVLTPCRLDTLCVGGWFALALRDPNLGPTLVLRARRWLAYAAAGVLALSVWHATVSLADDTVKAVRGTLLALLFGSFILLAARDEKLATVRPMLSARWLVALGKYSYGLYVFHGLVAHFMMSHETLAKLTERVDSRLLALGIQALVGVLVSLLLAVVSYELFEARFLRLKKRFEAT